MIYIKIDMGIGGGGRPPDNYEIENCVLKIQDDGALKRF